MTKLKRFTGKVFGGSATAVGDDPQIAQFGSALANTFVGTTDPEIIQQLPAWGQGWIGAVTPTQQYPALPEMTGAMKVLSHQICGILQQGVSTWDSGTIYYTGNFVSLNGKLYISQVDENQGNNPATDTTNWQEFSSGGGLEIGDVAFTQMAIDESKGKRRKLNGQIIIQEQYQQLTNILKASIAQNPDMACTEQEWQAEVTMSTAGICYKFVVDDVGGTIRLPKYPDYFIGGGNAPVVGNGTALGLTIDKINTFYMHSGQDWNGGDPNNNSTPKWHSKDGQLPYSAETTYARFGSNNTSAIGITTDPTKSGIEAQLDSAELIKGTYFIQVATGSETEDNIINEIELNNPFSLLDYKYSEYELNNLSWLRSNGQYNSKAIYPAVYDKILENINQGVKNFKGYGYAYITTNSTTGTQYNFYVSTLNPLVGATVYDSRGIIYGKISSLTSNGFSFLDELYNVNYIVVRDESKDKDVTDNSWITDYDFRINTAEETFRLPIKVKLASGKAVAGNGMTLGLTDGTQNTGLGLTGGSTSTEFNPYINNYGMPAGTAISGSKGTTSISYGITTDPIKSGIELSDNGLYLYFYVGETVQNANLVNVGRIEEKLSDCLTRNNKEEITSWGMPDYKNSISVTLPYVAPCNGVVWISAPVGTNKYFGVTIFIEEKETDMLIVNTNSGSSYGNNNALVPKGATLKVGYGSGGSVKFIPLKGAN